MMSRSEHGLHQSVLLVGNFLSEAIGTRSVSEDLAGKLTANGWQIITTSSQPGRVSRLFDMLQTVWRHRHHFFVAHVDVFSGPAFIWAEAVTLLLRHLKKPYILTLRGGNLPQFAKRFPRRVSTLLRSAAVVTTPSNYLLEQMQPYCRALRLLPNPIDLRSYPFRCRKAPRPKLVWLRAFHAIYNPSLAVEVVSLLVGEYPDLELNMVGPDKGDGSLPATQQLAYELGLDDRVHFPGAVPKPYVGTCLAQHDVFINTTTAESFGVSVLEAAACGLPVVTTNAGELPYLWQDEQDALLVPVGDAQAMADALRRVLADQELARCLSQNGRHKAEQYDWSTILPKWEALFNSAITHHERHSA